MKSGFTVVCLSLCWFLPPSWGKTPCHAVVRTNVVGSADSISLADLLLPESSCPELVAAAARARVGATPLAGSPRVMEGDQVRALLETTAARDGALKKRLLVLEVPQRVTIRGSPVPGLSALRPKRRIAVNALVKSGQRVELVWEQGGIRLRASAVCLEAGAAGDTVRAKFARTGRVVHALVLPDGSLQATS